VRQFMVVAALLLSSIQAMGQTSPTLGAFGSRHRCRARCAAPACCSLLQQRHCRAEFPGSEVGELIMPTQRVGVPGAADPVGHARED
jgi:hypothetical protein